MGIVADSRVALQADHFRLADGDDHLTARDQRGVAEAFGHLRDSSCR